MYTNIHNTNTTKHLMAAQQLRKVHGNGRRTPFHFTELSLLSWHGEESQVKEASSPSSCPPLPHPTPTHPHTPPHPSTSPPWGSIYSELLIAFGGSCISEPLRNHRAGDACRAATSRQPDGLLLCQVPQCCSCLGVRALPEELSAPEVM